MYVFKLRRSYSLLFAWPVLCIAFAAILALHLSCNPAYALQAAHVKASEASIAQIQKQAASIDEVRALIEALPTVTAVVEEDGEAIAQARAAYESLPADEQELLDTLTNRTALGTTQSYGRVLELAEAGYAVLHPVDDSTALANGLYSSSVTCSWNRGKSASKQDRDWSAVRVRVEDGHALVVLRVNSSTYSHVRASGQVVERLSASGDGESLFRFPVNLGSSMVFTAYSQTMATEIAYNLLISIPQDAQPDASLDEDDDQGGQHGPDTPAVAPQITTDAATGRVIVESGVFDHPEVAGYMFRMAGPVVIESDGEHMTAYFQMPSTAYSHLFLGSAEEANAKPLEEGVADGSFMPAKIAFDNKGDEVGCFTFPLESLDCDLALSLYSVKNKHWVDQKRPDRTIRLNSADLTWRDVSTIDGQTARVISLLEKLPARNTINPDDSTLEAAVKATRDAYEELDSRQKAQVPPRLTLLLEWDESMFELGFNTDFLPMAIAGQSYDGAIYLSGKNGSTGKSARVIEGSLPDGLELQADGDGYWAYFVGAPEKNGSWTFTVEVANDLGETANKEFTIYVGYAPKIMTDSLPNASIGSEYDAEIVADAYPDTTWSLAEGALPDGLVLVDGGEESSSAHIVGTPSQAGTFTFTLACDNFANGIERKEYSIVVAGSNVSPDNEAATLKQQIESALKRLEEHSQRISKLEALVIRQQQQIEALKAQASKQVTINSKVVTAKTVAKALKKAGNRHASTVILGPKVTRVKARAFKGTDVRTLVAQTTKLSKKSVRKALVGSKVKTVKVDVAPELAKKVKKRYKSAFAKKNSGHRVAIR